MSNEIENVDNIPQEANFTDMQLDAVGEIQNISMGSGATAMSNLLNAKVWITTPKAKIVKYSDLLYPNLEPAIYVKIDYIKGVFGSSTMILKQTDVQLMINQLMNMPLEVTDDFEFDELNISAVCEVMNQMMGSSATALSEFLGLAIDISTPEAVIKAEGESSGIDQFDKDQYVCATSFDLTIDGVIKSEFISVIDIDLATTLANKLLGSLSGDDEAGEQAPEPVQEEVKQPIPPVQEPVQQAPPIQQPVQEPIYQAPPMQQSEPSQDFGYNPTAPQQPMYGQPQQMGYQQPMYGQPSYAQPYPQQYGQQYGQQPIQVQPVQLQQFGTDINASMLGGEQQDNLKLLMNVPLSIKVELGSAKKSVRDILDFTQGTVIELERQAGAPVDIIVNGNLIARGDVVVIEDNFAVRITEIVKSPLLETLYKE